MQSCLWNRKESLTVSDEGLWGRGSCWKRSLSVFDQRGRGMWGRETSLFTRHTAALIKSCCKHQAWLNHMTHLNQWLVFPWTFGVFLNGETPPCLTDRWNESKLLRDAPSGSCQSIYRLESMSERVYTQQPPTHDCMWVNRHIQEEPYTTHTHWESLGFHTSPMCHILFLICRFILILWCSVRIKLSAGVFQSLRCSVCCWLRADSSDNSDMLSDLCANNLLFSRLNALNSTSPSLLCTRPLDHIIPGSNL